MVGRRGGRRGIAMPSLSPMTELSSQKRGKLSWSTVHSLDYWNHLPSATPPPPCPLFFVCLPSGLGPSCSRTASSSFSLSVGRVKEGDADFSFLEMIWRHVEGFFRSIFWTRKRKTGHNTWREKEEENNHLPMPCAPQRSQCGYWCGTKDDAGFLFYFIFQDNLRGFFFLSLLRHRLCVQHLPSNALWQWHSSLPMADLDVDLFSATPTLAPLTWNICTRFFFSPLFEQQKKMKQ